MKEALLKFLSCFVCGGNLSPSIFKISGREILDGVLKCDGCSNQWWVIGGVPRFIGEEFLVESGHYNYFFQKYIEEVKYLKELKKKGEQQKENGGLFLQEKTSEKFGYEWTFFKDWGWIPDESVSHEERMFNCRGGLVSNTISSFIKKSMFKPDDFMKGNLVLDAGCGNGRYTNQAASFGAEVIGVDLGRGVDAAFQHFKNLKNVHIIQGDLLNLPFKKDIFDFIFSIGVLMHTENAEKAFVCISKHIKKGGQISVHLYHKRNPIFEIIDRSIRFFSTRMGIEGNIRFAKLMAHWGKRLMKNGKWPKFHKYICVLPTVHHMYDWYSAPVATHHSYPEVKGWFQELGFEILQSNEPLNISLFKKPESLTLKGKKK